MMKKKILVMFYPLNKAMEYIEAGGTQFAPHHFWGYDQLKDTGCTVDYLSTNTEPTFWNKLGKKLGINVLQQQIDCLKAAGDYDLVFVPFMEFSFLMALLKTLKLYHKPIVAISHFPYVPQQKNFLKRLKINAVRYVYYKGTDLILHYNQAVFDKSEGSGIKGNTMFLDNWGIDDEFFSTYLDAQTKAPTEDYIYTTGGSARDFNTLIEAFNTIDFKLKITTVGNFKGYKDCRITPNILIDNSLPFGLGSTGIIRKEYYNALAVAVPLQRVDSPEPYGITVLMEAMAMAKPVITTNNRGFPMNIEKEKVGFTIDYGDVAGWRQAVQYVIDHPEEAREMGERGQALIERKYNYRLFSRRINQQVMKLMQVEKVSSNVAFQVLEKEFSTVDK